MLFYRFTGLTYVFIAVCLLHCDAQVPNLISHFSKQTWFSGTNQSIKCIFSTPANITWHKDGAKINDNTQVIKSDGVNNTVESVLRFTNIAVEDSGQYECIGNNSGKSTRHNDTIRIYALVKFVERPSSKLDFARGSNKTISCGAVGSPVPSILWKFNGVKVVKLNDSRITQDVTYISNHTVVSSLHFFNVSESDQGKVECLAINSFSEDTTSSEVLIHDLPNIISLTVDEQRIHGINLSWNLSKPITNIFRGFKVLYGIKDEIFTKGTSISIRELLPETKYRFCITVDSIAGSGASTCIAVMTRKEYKLETLTLTQFNFTARSIILRWNRSKKLTYVDPTHFIQISAFKNNSFVRSHNVSAVNGTVSGIYTFTGLSPYSGYMFYAVQIMGSNQSNRSNTVNVTTLQDAPSMPRNIQVTAHSKSLEIVWMEPEMKNGHITEFTIFYSFKKGDEYETNKTVVAVVNATKREVTITNLYPNVLYYIEVVEKTISYGDVGKTSYSTTEGFPQVPFGVNYMNLNPKTTKITWLPLPKYLQGGELLGYRLTYITIADKIKDDGKPTSIFIPIENGTSNEKTLQNLKPYTAYEVTLAANNKIGDGEKNTRTFLTEQAPPSAPLNLESISIRQGPEKHTIFLKWDPPKDLNGEINKYQVVYRKVLVCTRNRCRRNMGLNLDYYDTITGKVGNSGVREHFIEKPLDPFSVYDIKVRESTAGGWGEYSTTIKATTKMGKPTKPLNLTALQVEHDSITISWLRPLHLNGIISRYEIYMHKGSKLMGTGFLEISTENEDLTYKITKNVEAETIYSVKVKAIVGKTQDQSNYSIPLYVTTPQAPAQFPWMFILIGCLVAILLVALLITVILLISKRRQKYKHVKTTEEMVTMNGVSRSKLVHVDELKQYSLQQHANSDHGFQQEFESVRIPIHTFTWEHSQMPANQIKNRYSNIVAYDHSRVVLSVIDNDINSDYINASYIDAYKQPKKYIATQGPLPETVLDFWRMVWEQEASIIVMLTRLVEDSRVKCEQYWPEGKGLQYRDIIVSVNSISEMTDYTVRVFTLHKLNQPEIRREVRQYHYTAWPDHGVPSHPTSLLSFIRRVMTSIDQITLHGPIVVHCSAGVGRTGTFIAIESNLRQIASESTVDVFGVVCKMRMHRNFMVQVEAQYTLIYDALLDSVVCGNTEISPADLIAKINSLKKQDPGTGETGFAAEFKLLESGISVNEKNKYGDAAHPDNKQKNRFLNILPYDYNRVKLVPIAGSRQSDYINASIIDGFQQKNAFIATQAPLENTVNDFWRMVLEQNIHIIVMLTKLEEKGQDKCYLYWPQAGTVSYGTIHVELIDVHAEDEKNLLIHDLRLTNRETGRSWLVTQFVYTGWPEYGSPESGSELIQLIGMVQQTCQQNIDSGPILVHCSGGVGRTGVFMAVFNSIERLKAKDVVDIFQTTRALRLQRTAMVQTIDQYMFCYQSLIDYLNSFHLYVNSVVT